MTRWLTLMAVLFQVAVLGYLAGEREWIVRHGDVVHLRTAPVDPRDLFRGDYVRLRYEISSPARPTWDRELAAHVDAALKGNGRRALAGQRVYASLVRDADGLASLAALSLRTPAKGPFLRGRIETAWTHGLEVRYGLEAYFVQQGKGLELERGRDRDRIRVPLEMAVALGGGGTGVLTGHRWSPLGIGLDLEQERQDNTVFLRAATVTLLNASDRPLAILDVPGGRAFELVPEASRWRDGPAWAWVGRGAEAVPAPAAAQTRRLQPGETISWRIDFSDPAWFVARPGEAARSIEQLNDWSTRFRLVYRPPPAAGTAHLDGTEPLWQGRIASATFGPGGVD
jgi:uncharacterized membrane-anchored protein